MRFNQSWKSCKSHQLQSIFDAKNLGVSHADLRGYLPGRVLPKKPLDGELARRVSCNWIWMFEVFLQQGQGKGIQQYDMIMYWLD